MVHFYLEEKKKKKKKKKELVYLFLKVIFNIKCVELIAPVEGGKLDTIYYQHTIYIYHITL